MHQASPLALDPSAFGALLGQLLLISDDAVIAADTAHRIVFFNEGAARMFGYTASQVLGQPLAMLMPERSRGIHASHIEAFSRSKSSARGLAERSGIRGQRADGSVFDAEASIARLDIQGATYYAAILHDVSAARKALRALERSEARFRDLAATAPVGIFQADIRRNCIYVNERWSSLSGMAAHAANGSGWGQAIHPADRPAVHKAWMATVERLEPFDMRYRFLHADGKEVWVVGRAVAGRAAGGGASGFLGTVTDVTESHQQALALERAKSEAESAVRAKSMFLANMSHEIRTPLNAVIGMGTLLMDTPLSDEQREFARTIHTSSESLLEIINDILDYSKADVGKLEIEQQAFDLRRCVEQALDQVAPRAVQKQLNLAYLIDDGTPEMLIGDEARMRQILVNLLSNAVKFTHHGEVYVHVMAHALEQDACRIRLSVRDTGIGIAAEHLPRLFQSFMQVDSSTTRKFGGTGLGLAICKRLAELMGGTVSVQSEPDAGSTFHVDVPMRIAPAGERPDFLERDAPALVGKRLLIVHDNQTNRRILTRLALLWGMIPATVPSAPEALDRLRHGEAFDLAILDMHMPGLDGMEFAQHVHSHGTVSAMPIIMLTTLGQRQVLDDHRSAHVAAVLSKPIKANQLHATLHQVVHGQRPQRTRAEPTVPSGPRQVRATPAMPLRVLVAEDNAVNQRVASLLLRRLGYEAAVASNGLEVLEAVEREPFDIVLMDIQMPEMDGLQAARWIVQRRPPQGRPRIIAMTANAMPGDREAYLEAGIDAYVAKPIRDTDLAAAIEQVAGQIQTPAHGSNPSTSVLDHARLEHLRSIGQGERAELVGELIDMFVADSPAHLETIEAASDHGDLGKLARAVHRYLSVTQNIGAERLSRLCIDIERLALRGEAELAGQRVRSLAAEFRLAKTELLATRAEYVR